MDLRPREERDYAEFYSNLDETTPLQVFVVGSKSAASSHPENSTVTSASNKNSTDSKSFTLNTTLRDYKNAREKKARAGRATKHSSAVEAYGYRPISRPKLRPSQCYARFHQPVTSQFLSRYDMDEQDELYLEWLNSGQADTKVSNEVFEIVMSLLEHEWHKLELKMTASVGGGQEGRDILEMDANFEKYGSDDGTGGVDSISEQRCAICNDSECDNTNSIVYCDGCNIAVHQECYGVAFIPEGQWFCRRCMVNGGSTVSCAFCPSKTGAFKQLDNGMWSHVVCALWIREVYFANPVYLEPIEGVASIPRSRWTLVCYICKQKTGACIQCVARKCTQAYHVTCAKRAGLYMVMEKEVQGAVASNDTLKSYCDRHSPAHVDKNIAFTGIHQTRMFFRDSHSLSRKNDRLASERRQANRVNRFKWKTENGTPIAPQSFVDVVVELMKSLKIGDVSPDRMLRGLNNSSPKSQDKEGDFKTLGAALCRYWCLKRESKNGAPLIRISAAERELLTHDPVPSEGLQSPESRLGNGAETSIPTERSDSGTQMPEKIAFGNDLQKDLQKLIQLNRLATKRQKLILEQHAEMFKSTDNAYFAFKAAGQEIMQKMCGLLSRDSRKEDTAHLQRGFERIMSDIADGAIRTARDMNSRVQSCLGGRAYNPTSGSIAKVLRYWSEVGMQEMETVEVRQSEGIPFTEIDGLTVSFRNHHPQAILNSEDLSENEEDPFLQPANRKIFQGFVSR